MPDIINTDYYDNLIAQVDSALNCEDLQSAASKILESLEEQKQAILAQLDKLAPIAELTTLPTNIGQVITWIGKLKTALIDPLYLPVVTYQAQLIIMAEKLAEVVASIEAKASELPSCTIDVGL